MLILLWICIHIANAMASKLLSLLFAKWQVFVLYLQTSRSSQWNFMMCCFLEITSFRCVYAALPTWSRFSFSRLSLHHHLTSTNWHKLHSAHTRKGGDLCSDTTTALTTRDRPIGFTRWPAANLGLLIITVEDVRTLSVTFSTSKIHRKIVAICHQFGRAI